MTPEEEDILREIIEAYSNGKTVGQLPDIEGTELDRLMMEVVERGASKKAMLGAIAVTLSSQVLTQAQKVQARDNIDAALKVMHVVETSTTISSLTPNVLHMWNTPLSTLQVLSLAVPEDSNGYSEYMLRFTAASDFVPAEPMFPSTIRWANEPDFSAGYTYEISILDNIGVILEIGGDE